MSRNYSKKLDIKVTVDIIKREDIPSNFFLPRYSEKNDWKQIFHFKFSNKFDFYMGSNESFVDGTDLMTILSIELDVVNESDNPFQFKQKLKKEYDSYITSKNAIKVYNWYKRKSNKVEKILEQFMLD